jgi:hypothetical protein
MIDSLWTELDKVHTLGAGRSWIQTLVVLKINNFLYVAKFLQHHFFVLFNYLTLLLC